MRRQLLAVFLFGTLLVPHLYSETILLPVLTNDTPGAFGSVWTSAFSILNRGASSLLVHGAAPPPPPGLGLPPQEDFEVPANQTLSYVPYTPVLSFGAPVAKLLHVEDTHAGDLEVDLRIQDISRQSSTFGTEIPTVRESSAATKPVDLLIVRADENFRSLLRVYDFDPAPGHAVLVRLYKPAFSLANPATDQLLSETTLNFQVPSDTFNYPGYAQMYVPSDVSPVRIEIVPLNEGLRFWAFASVTNNATQHVTLVVP